MLNKEIMILFGGMRFVTNRRTIIISSSFLKGWRLHDNKFLRDLTNGLRSG